MSTLFREAIERRELRAFALGERRYFVHDRSGMGRGDHWVLGSWYLVMALYRDDPTACAAGVRKMFEALLPGANDPPYHRAWPLLDHLSQFWREHSNGAQLDLGAMAPPIARTIAAERVRCRAGEGDAPVANIDLAIAGIRRFGGLAELVDDDR